MKPDTPSVLSVKPGAKNNWSVLCAVVPAFPISNLLEEDAGISVLVTSIDDEDVVSTDALEDDDDEANNDGLDDVLVIWVKYDELGANEIGALFDEVLNDDITDDELVLLGSWIEGRANDDW